MHISYGDGQRLTPDETLSYYGFVEQAAGAGAAAQQELCTLGSSRVILLGLCEPYHHVALYLCRRPTRKYRQ